ncbi:hypothetical protein [Spongiibacter tropicus]|uniref:hypothetical protein n=1 Tax=Spongiibacter tropicus TaxID=454602 RepID=UPI0003B59015|nr:hypothetical protein [Spongiibacter tropicus]
MKLLPLICILLLPTLAIADDFRLVLMLGEIEEVNIKAQRPKEAKPGEVLLDHSCGSEVVTFRVDEYLTGDGMKERKLSRVIASYNCDSSWNGMPVSPSIAMLSQWPTHSIYRGTVRLTETTEGYQVVDYIPQLLSVLSIHEQKEPEMFLSSLKEPIIRLRGSDQGTDELKYLASLGVVEYQAKEIDLNENCISGCEKGNIIKVYEVKYKKGIPLSKLRGKKF